MSNPPVTAVMVTSGTEARRRLAVVPLACFRAQTYANRRLLVLNHGETPVFEPADDVQELLVKRPPTLGGLRNLLFAHVKEGYAITWDDDDWCHPDRIKRQLAAAQRGKHRASILPGYLTLDLSNGKVFARDCRHFKAGGACGTILFAVEGAPRYPTIDRSEDSEFALAFLSKKRLAMTTTGCGLYVRTWHGGNTTSRLGVLDSPAGRRRPSAAENGAAAAAREAFAAAAQRTSTAT